MLTLFSRFTVDFRFESYSVDAMLSVPINLYWFLFVEILLVWMALF